MIPIRAPGFAGQGPAIEPRSGAVRIEGSNERARTGVLAPVHDDVDDRMAHFSWRPKRASVVSLGPEAPSPIEQCVYPARNANGNAGHAPRKGVLVVRLDEQVDVIALHGKVDEPEPLSGRASERFTNFRENDLLPQARQTPAEP